jgi:hypothetical protein
LRPSDKDVLLDLQAVLDRAYRAGRYETTDYARSCEPALELAVAA